MPPTDTMFRLSRIVASAVVFISLCAPSGAETRRCYWCGPLADQVHRSQRAPPCSAPHTEVTDCDPGFPYCAVVATSPPYIESRYCVKLYQDECYTLYCNSTRTWRMSCPCRGDLCNGPNTERELDAFAGLAKLVASTQRSRNRRALITKTGFISMNTNRKNRIDNTTVEENKNILNNLTDNNEGNEADVKDNEIQMDDVNTTVDADVKDMDTQIDTTAASVPPDVKNDETQTIETTTLAEVADVELKITEATTNSPSDITEEVIKTSNSHLNETSIQIDIPSVNIESNDLKTEIILMSSETTKVLNDTKLTDISSPNLNIPDVLTTPEIITQTAIESKATTTEATKTAPTEVKMNENKIKPSEQLPTVGPPVTVGPLQHGTTAAKSTPNAYILTTTSNPQNNTAVRIYGHIVTRFILAISIVLNYVEDLNYKFYVKLFEF